MYDLDTRRRAMSLVRGGHSLSAVSARTGVSRSTLRSWRDRPEPADRDPRCARCDPGAVPPPVPDYSYLLGLYLGDGCLSRAPRGGHVLRVACAAVYPGLVDACERAIRAVHPTGSVCRVPAPGCVHVTSYFRHWPCLFPQHGPGRKHERAIVLAGWQEEIVARCPWEFVRGLLHSDGCRLTNRTGRVVGGERRAYAYPRYFFTNRSADIRALFTGTLDRLGVAWRQANDWNVSVARRDAVALLDRHVGPKG